MTKNILIFEPDASGHHSGYLYHLIINFLSANYPYNLTVLVAPDFFEQHPQIIQETTSPKVKWLAFADSEFSAWKITKSQNVTKRAFLSGIYCENTSLKRMLLMLFRCTLIIYKLLC